jgi:hypothetical protein
VLLDECVDRRLAPDIQGHDVKTVPEAGWAALKNGDLLSRAQHEFDTLVTTDRSLPFQQDLSRFSIVVIVLRAQSNRVTDLRRLIPGLLAALPWRLAPGVPEAAASEYGRLCRDDGGSPARRSPPDGVHVAYGPRRSSDLEPSATGLQWSHEFILGYASCHTRLEAVDVGACRNEDKNSREVSDGNPKWISRSL